MSSEFFNALTRFYATKQAFPWGVTTQNGVTASSIQSNISDLMNAGELKNNFITRVGANLGKIMVYSTAGTDLSICFQPISKAMQVDPNTIFDSGTQVTTNT